MRRSAHRQSFKHSPRASKCPEGAAVHPNCPQLSKQASSHPELSVCLWSWEREVLGEEGGQAGILGTVRQGLSCSPPGPTWHQCCLPSRVSPIPDPPHCGPSLPNVAFPHLLMPIPTLGPLRLICSGAS